MQTATDNLMQIASELNAAGKQVKVTVLKPRKARRSELIMSSTKGVRTNTNRRGQAYTGHATYATQSTVEGNRSAYFKTSGWSLMSTLPWAVRDVKGGAVVPLWVARMSRVLWGCLCKREARIKKR